MLRRCTVGKFHLPRAAPSLGELPTPTVQLPLTIIIELDVAGERIVRSRKHRPFVFQKLPLRTICGPLLLPPRGNQKNELKHAEGMGEGRGTIYEWFSFQLNESL